MAFTWSEPRYCAMFPYGILDAFDIHSFVI